MTVNGCGCVPFKQLVTPLLYLSGRQRVCTAPAEAIQETREADVPVHHCLPFPRLLSPIGFEKVVKQNRLRLWFWWPFTLADGDSNFFANLTRMSLRCRTPFVSTPRMVHANIVPSGALRLLHNANIPAIALVTHSCTLWREPSLLGQKPSLLGQKPSLLG